MINVLKLLRREVYLALLLSILLFVSIDISSNNHIVLGKQDSTDDNEVEEDSTEEETIEEVEEDSTEEQTIEEVEEDSTEE
ncbi:MAG: hypothetical protein K0S93_1619, partial [Nitrososphaeraceae archaeon]|nr:hypothetical protein [Nitrososphaeraceae archaeon]